MNYTGLTAGSIELVISMVPAVGDGVVFSGQVGVTQPEGQTVVKDTATGKAQHNRLATEYL